MTEPDSLPLHALAEDNLAVASPDLLRAMVKTFADGSCQRRQTRSATPIRARQRRESQPPQRISPARVGHEGRHR
ncbi:hypothetical protein GCM10022295_90760 [Streptomyces osmaniensis]|uniref:Uncharacterized protein n=1 Tax=Streptomyces osmaniensis TaxID=593134 RepID=A0ABP6Z0S5_9ACTN